MFDGDSSHSTCEPCTNSSHCSHLSETPVCITVLNGLCVECNVDSDCHSPAKAQCFRNNTCVNCTESSQCEHFSVTPVCNADTGTCVECLWDSGCVNFSNGRCSAATNTCMIMCPGYCLECRNATACKKMRFWILSA